MKKLLLVVLLVISSNAFAVRFWAKGSLKVGPYFTEQEVVNEANAVLPSIKDGSHVRVKELARENNCSFYKDYIKVGPLVVQEIYVDSDEEFTKKYVGTIQFKVGNCIDK